MVKSYSHHGIVKLIKTFQHKYSSTDIKFVLSILTLKSEVEFPCTTYCKRKTNHVYGQMFEFSSTCY